MALQFLSAYTIVLFLGWQQVILALPEKLTPVQNITGCGSTDTSLKMDEVQLLVRDTINPYINRKYGPVCGCGGPGWKTIVDLDMSDTSQTCPTSNWRVVTSGSLRSCGRTNIGCQSALFSSGGTSYSQVCGRILAVQFGHPDGLAEVSSGIDNVYVDGISITHGSIPRKHIWTFAGIVSEHIQYRYAFCPCTNENASIPDSAVPSWIGNNYYCDTANTGNTHPVIFYPNNPLFDGQGCGPAGYCCTKNNPPWFCASLPSATTDSIEVRMCGNEAFNAEDTLITRMQIYVK